MEEGQRELTGFFRKERENYLAATAKVFKSEGGGKLERERNKPLLAVIHVHLLFSNGTPCSPINSQPTPFSSFTTLFSLLTKPTLSRAVGPTCLPIRPVEARLENDSVDMSDEQDALRDKLGWRSNSCPFRSTFFENPLEGGIQLFVSFFPSLDNSLLGCAGAGFGAVGLSVGLSDGPMGFLLPPGTKTGLASSSKFGSVVFRDRTLVGPDIAVSSNPTLNS
jgi:hypothetical protein